MKNFTSQGVLVLVAHLIITLAIIGGYLFSVYTGNPDETFKLAIFTIVGFWFGAVGKDMRDMKTKEKGEKPVE